MVNKSITVNILHGNLVVSGIPIVIRPNQVATQVVRWSGIPVDARSSLGWRNKSCDL